MSPWRRFLTMTGVLDDPLEHAKTHRRRADAEYYGEDQLNYRMPAAYEDVEEIAELLKEEQPVVVNLIDTDPDDRRRVVDFLFGVVYAVDGDVCRVEDAVFIFTPNRIRIDSPDGEMARRAFGPTPLLRPQPLRQKVASM